MSYKLLNFKTHQLFYSYVNSHLPEFDIKASATKGRFTFVYKGEVHGYRNLYVFLTKLNELLEKELFLVKESRITSRTRYKIFVDSDVEDKINGEEVTNTVVVEKPFVEGTGEVVMASHNAPLITQEEGVVEQEDVEFEIDWEWIESLEDTPENKLLLDNYAEKHSDVNLKRNMKLPNMVRAYKKALAEK